MKTITFVAIERDGIRDGTYGWKVLVDGVEILDRVKSGDTDFANAAFEDVYKAIDVKVDFDWDDEPYAT